METKHFQTLCPSIVIVHVIRQLNGMTECLLLRRSGSLKGCWQMVTGKMHDNEQAIDAAKRELLEETGLIADRLYSADFIETFFEPRYNAIFIAPVFVAFIDQDQPIILSQEEHDDYQWLPFNEALLQLEFAGQRNALNHIEAQFIHKTPNQRLLLASLN